MFTKVQIRYIFAQITTFYRFYIHSHTDIKKGASFAPSEKYRLWLLYKHNPKFELQMFISTFTQSH